MNDEENGLETVPLNSRLSFASQSSRVSSTPRRSSLDVPSSSNNNASSRSLLQQAFAVLVFALFGWYFPRHLIRAETSIQNKTVPFQKTAAGDVILHSELNQPLTDPPTTPSTFLIWTSVWIPLLLVALVAWSCASSSRLKRIHDVHASVCGLLTAIGLSEGSTQLLKLYIQRRRPNFYALCTFDTKLLKCTASLDYLREASFSFPSGHSSLACCAMTFLVWFFLGKIAQSSSLSRASQRFLGMLACVVPWSWAMFVGASRIVDGWHHPSDVVAGLMLGAVMATIAYHVWYPPVWLTAHAGIPWSLQSMELTKLASFHE